MADPGRRPKHPAAASHGHSTPRVAMPKVPVTTRQTAKKVAPQVLELTKHVGERVKITNILHQEFTGVAHALENHELILDTTTAADESYHIIQLSKIYRFDVLPPATTVKEREPLAHTQAERLATPAGVSPFGHRIFLMLDKTLPVRWHDKTIVVLDSVLVEPPYDVENCKAPAKNEKQLARVRELVKAELAKVPKNTWDRRGG